MLDYEKIGERIYQQRKQVKHMSQEQLAEAMGWYQSDISNLEKAKSGSGITDLYKLDLIAEYFGIPLQHLLFGEGDGNTMKQNQTTTPVSHAALQSLAAEIHSIRDTIKMYTSQLEARRQELQYALQQLYEGHNASITPENLTAIQQRTKETGDLLNTKLEQLQQTITAMRNQFRHEMPDVFLRMYNEFEYDVKHRAVRLEETKADIRNYEALLKELQKKQKA